MTRNFVGVNRGFLWGVIGEDGIGGQGGIGVATFAFIHQRRCGGPGAGVRGRGSEHPTPVGDGSLNGVSYRTCGIGNQLIEAQHVK